jgi:hypothetical protein
MHQRPPDGAAQTRKSRPNQACGATHLGPRRTEVLEQLVDYFCLRTIDLARLIYSQQPTAYHIRHIERTTQALRKERLVVSERIYIPTSNGHFLFPLVHGLTRRGVDEYGGKTFEEHRLSTIPHDLEISLFHIAVKQFAQANGIEFYWQQNDLKRGVHADALFALTFPMGTYYFFLEIEKSGLGNSRNSEPGIVRKMARYAEYYDSDQCRKDWDFRYFRVIVVQRTDLRRRNLLTALEAKCCHRIFWLTTEALYKEDIAGEIFLTPRDHRESAYSLLRL